MTIQYEIKFLDYWHLSSGLSAGAKADSVVVKDSNDLPYVPGKTIKGMVREMAELLNNEALVARCFGVSGEEMGSCYFSNATLSEDISEKIVKHKVQSNLYDYIAATKIGEKGKKGETEGIAVDNSLREIEVVVPLALYGEINDVPEDDAEDIAQALKMVKRMGLNRNRGLGRCECTMEVVK